MLRRQLGTDSMQRGIFVTWTHFLTSWLTVLCKWSPSRQQWYDSHTPNSLYSIQCNHHNRNNPSQLTSNMCSCSLIPILESFSTVETSFLGWKWKTRVEKKTNLFKRKNWVKKKTNLFLEFKNPGKSSPGFLVFSWSLSLTPFWFCHQVLSPSFSQTSCECEFKDFIDFHQDRSVFYLHFRSGIRNEKYSWLR